MLPVLSSRQSSYPTTGARADKDASSRPDYSEGHNKDLKFRTVVAGVEALIDQEGLSVCLSVSRARALCLSLLHCDASSSTQG